MERDNDWNVKADAFLKVLENIRVSVRLYQEGEPRKQAETHIKKLLACNNLPDYHSGLIMRAVDSCIFDIIHVIEYDR